MRDRRFDFREMLLHDKIELRWAEPAGTLTQCTGILSDLSVSGVQVKVDHAIRPETPVGITVRGKELQGKVQYCTRAQTTYLVGLAFETKSRAVLKPSI